MIFSVIGATGTAVRDPETGEDLGTLPIEKARIRVTEVYSSSARPRPTVSPSPRSPV